MIFEGQALVLYTDADRLEQHMKELAPEDADTIDELMKGVETAGKLEVSVMKAPEVQNLTERAGSMLKMLPHLSFAMKWAKFRFGDYGQRFKNPFLREALVVPVEDVADIPAFGMFHQIAWFGPGVTGYPVDGSMEGADLSNANLQGARLAAGNMAGVDLSGAQLSGALGTVANMGGASLHGAQLRAAKINAANLENADLTEADLTHSRWFGANVAGAEFSGAKTTGARASGVDWSQAKVPPAEIPEPMPVPPWLPALLTGIGVLFVVVIILAEKRRRVQAR